jgi:hypothetical protein
MTDRRRLVLFALGFVLVGLGPFLFTTTCTDVGSAGEAEGGFELRGTTGLTVTYSPDGGVNTCTAGLGPVYLPIGIALVVLALRG